MAVTTYRENNLNRMVAMIVGWVLLLVGIWGFFQDPILGIFETGILHNLIHLLSGAALLGAAYANRGLYARQANLTLAAIYLVVTLLGFLAPSLLGAIIQYNMADNWLHLALTVVLGGAALAAGRAATRPAGGAIR